MESIWLICTELGNGDRMEPVFGFRSQSIHGDWDN